MSRWLTLIAVLLAVLAGSLSTISAQAQSTPVAGDSTGAVTIFGNDGQPAGTIEVNSIVDPFTEYDAGSAPQRGFHYVMADISFTATSRSIDTYSYAFSIVDTEGFLYSPTYVYLPSEMAEAQPEFTGGTVEVGQTMSGAVYFQVLGGTTPAFIVYQPAYDQLITVADLRDEQVTQGDAIEYLTSDGQPAALVTVNDLVMPLQDYEASYAPQRGFEYVGVVVTIENIGARDFEVDAYDFAIVDAEGFVSNSYSVYRTTDAETALSSLQYNGALAPGESVTGLVSFQVLAGTEPGLVYFNPSSDRHVRIAEYGDGQAPQPSGTPAAVPTRPSLGASETPAAGQTPTTSTDCDAVVEWAEASLPNISAWAEAFVSIDNVFSGGTVDADAARAAADAVLEAAGNQAALDVPEIAEAAHEALIEAFEQSATALYDLADAAEENDAAAMLVAAQTIAQIGSSAQSGDLNILLEELDEACPELADIGA